MYNLQEDMYEQLKEKYCIFKEWRSSTWTDPYNG